MPYDVKDFEEIPIIPDGYIRKQGRDKDGRFNSIIEYVPDPDYMPEYHLSKIYIIDFDHLR